MRVFVSGRMFAIVSASVLPPRTLPFASIATYDSSSFVFGLSCRSRPRISTPNSTDAFGAVPLNGAANTCIVRPLTGSGLSSASVTSGVAGLVLFVVDRRRPSSA